MESEAALWKLSRHGLVRRLNARWPGPTARHRTECTVCQVLGDESDDDALPQPALRDVEQALIVFPQDRRLRECRHCGALFETWVTGPPAADSLFETTTRFRRVSPAEAIEHLGGIAGGPPRAAASDPDGASGLLVAAESGDQREVGALLERGADANQCDDFRNTPLLVACRAGHGAIASQLVAAGAATAVANGDGDTPLMEAARRGDQGLVELLLAHGADPTWKNKAGETASTLASSGGSGALASRLRRENDLWPFTTQKWYLRNFDHCQESRQDHDRFLFYEGGRFLDTWWNPKEKRLAEVHESSPSEFHELFSLRRYDERSPFVGNFSEIPIALREAASAVASRGEQLVARLIAANGKEWLDVASPTVRGRWYVWRVESEWFRLCGSLGMQWMSADAARREIEETLTQRPDVEPKPAEARIVRKAERAAEKARNALSRLHAGEVWSDDGRHRFSLGSRLYFAFWRPGGSVESMGETSDEKVYGELFEACARSRKALRIAPAPRFFAAIAPLIDEKAYPELLRQGRIVIGGGHTTESTWIISCRDGHYLLDRSDSQGGRSEAELSEAQVQEILSGKKYGWVK